jgi:hypothetical protein
MSAALPLDPEAVRLAATVRFADSNGGPLIVMSESAAKTWRGVFDDTGKAIYGDAPCDYDLACDAGGFELFDVRSAKALSLETPDNGAAIARADGALIVRWVGADDKETLLTAALAAPDADYKDLAAVFEHDGSRLFVFDAGSDGSAIEMDRVSAIELPAGTYKLSLLVEWSGPVTGADGAPHDTMVQVVRLRRD